MGGIQRFRRRGVFHSIRAAIRFRTVANMPNEGADALQTRALRLSNEEAEREETDHVVSAVRPSKIDALPLSGDDSVIFRLTRVSNMIHKAMFEASELQGPVLWNLAANCTLI